MEPKYQLHSFSPEIATEYLRFSHPSRSQVIYVCVIFFVVCCLVALPLLSVSVSVKSSGILKTASEINLLKSPASGRIEVVSVRENENVVKGQLLFAVQSPLIDEKLRFAENRAREAESFIADLKTILSEGQGNLKSVDVLTSLYKQSIHNFLRQVNDRQLKLQRATQDYNRNKELYDQRVIAAADFEIIDFEYKRAKNELDMLWQSQLNAWRQELQNYEHELRNIKNERAQLVEEKETLSILAPIDGSIQNMAGIYSGSPVFAGQELAQISPEGDLIAEVYVSPSDIGMLENEMNVRMQVSAFNYNQWGLLEGVVSEISSDIFFIEDRPVFKVRCRLQKDFLMLRNGYVGRLKKGMAVQARFIVAERTLWQLLFDKVDDWLNPNIKSVSRVN